MTEQQEGTQAVETTAAEARYTREDLDRAKNNLIAQIRERDERLAAIEKGQQEAAQKQMVEQQQYRELAETLQKQLAEVEAREKAELAKRDRALTHEQIRRELASSGLTDEVQHLGLIAKFESMEQRPSISEWVASLRNAEPHRFAALGPQGRSTGSVGTVKPSAPESLEARLQSKDPKVKQAALKEQLEASLLAR